MTRRIFSTVVAVLLTAGNAPAQTFASTIKTAGWQEPPPTQKPAVAPVQEPADDVVRITSKLVQLDLVVTDKNGAQVTDLKAEDFEIFEDGHSQPITHFSYIISGPASGSSLTNAADGQPIAASSTAPVSALRREKVRRTIAIVIDDLGMSYVTTRAARVALKKFVDEQIQPGDLVAIIRTGGTVGTLQQFTNDKRQLLASVERVRWNQCSRSGITVLPAAGNAFAAPICAMDSTLASIEVLRSVIVGMRQLPGRKSLILVADGFPVEKKEDPTKLAVRPSLFIAVDGFRGISDNTASTPKSVDRPLSFDPSRQISEAAIRSSVVIYALDTRGLSALSPTAADNLRQSSTLEMKDLLTQRSDLDMVGRSESGQVADATGGLFIQNTNDLNLGLNRIMQDQRGYYLLGYRPGSDTFDRRFHNISARVKNRSDLRVRTRSGFYGVTEEELPKAPADVDRFQLALMSPFAASDIDVRLTPVFTSLPSTGPVLRTLLHISARDLTFKEQPDGWRTAELVLRGLLFGDNGQIIDEHRRAFSVRVRGATFDRIQSQGFDYIFNMPTKKPGGYQFRIALLDTVSSRVGSAGQYVEIPDLKQKRLALSGIILNAAALSGETGPVTSAVDAGEGPVREANSGARRFRINSSLNYDYLIFNAGGNPSSGQLNALVRLFQDGKLVFEHQSAVEIMQQIDPARLLVGGRLTLGTNLRPGEYVLQITVTDPSEKKGQGLASQSADFEIVQ